MKLSTFDRSIFALIAIALAVIAFRPIVRPPAAMAQEEALSHVYIEPGVHALVAPDKSQQVLGKVVVDLRTGNVWGFPTTTKVPYPVDSLKNTPPVSYPIYLGKFDFASMQRSR